VESQVKPQLITPPAQEANIYPYRRVWASIIIEAALLTITTLVVMYLPAFLPIPAPLEPWFTLGSALLPCVLWCIFSWVPEGRAQVPRNRLLPVFVITAMAANSIGYPLIYRILEVESWGNQQELVNKIVIYALAFGVVPETLKYLVLRYTVWLNQFRNRYDAIAYAAASAVAYATVLNLRYVLDTTPPADIAVLRIFGTTALQIMGSLIVAYGLAEIRLSKPSPLLVPGMITLASLITGIIITVRGNIANTRLGLSVSYPRTIFNYAITAIALGGIALAMIFLFQNTEKQSKQAEKDPRD
jgi:RsiW-degrading membrane proteinase PrsW (M82 family)